MVMTHNAYLVLPRLRVQNLNTISSPLTWGAPSITAVMGFMSALQRQMPKEWRLLLLKAGMVIHDFEPQVNGSWVKKFNLTRNPLGKGGETLGIVEEGRAHATISLVFGVRLMTAAESMSEWASQILALAENLRFAGGSIIPNPTNRLRPRLLMVDEADGETHWAIASLRRSLLPGFSLISRDDLLVNHVKKIQQQDPQLNELDAWLDLSRVNRQCVIHKNDEQKETIEWRSSRAKGGEWIVPIPVGYSQLSPCYEPGEVRNARDPNIPFCFVESMYSIGQWVSPHRLSRLEELLWSTSTDHEKGIYRCLNSNSLQSN